jgi:hypothetical protein
MVNPRERVRRAASIARIHDDFRKMADARLAQLRQQEFALIEERGLIFQRLQELTGEAVLSWMNRLRHIEKALVILQAEMDEAEAVQQDHARQAKASGRWLEKLSLDVAREEEKQDLADMIDIAMSRRI